MPLAIQNKSFQRSFQDGMEVWGTFRSNKTTKSLQHDLYGILKIIFIKIIHWDAFNGGP